MEHNRGRFEVSLKLVMFDKQENKQKKKKKNENGKFLEILIFVTFSAILRLICD